MMNPFKNLKRITSPKRLFRKKPSYSSDSSTSITTPTSVLRGAESSHQLEAILTKLGPHPLTHQEMEHMFKEVGTTLDDVVLSGDEMELRETFEVFDKNGDGRITAEELLDVFKGILGDGECSLDECMKMVAGVDSNNDGAVSFDEFCVMMMMQEQQQQHHLHHQQRC